MGNHAQKQWARSLLAKEKMMWTEGDLNPRLPRCERGDHTRLIYRPFNVALENGDMKYIEITVTLHHNMPFVVCVLLKWKKVDYLDLG